MLARFFGADGATTRKKVHMLHMVVFPVISWCSGCRARRRSVPLSPRRAAPHVKARLADVEARDAETWDEYWSKSTRQVERVEEYCQPCCLLGGDTRAMSCGSRLRFRSLLSTILPWRHAWWRETLIREACAGERQTPPDTGWGAACVANRPPMGRSNPTRVLAPPSGYMSSGRRLEDSGRGPRRVARP